LFYFLLFYLVWRCISTLSICIEIKMHHVKIKLFFLNLAWSWSWKSVFYEPIHSKVIRNLYLYFFRIWLDIKVMKNGLRRRVTQLRWTNKDLINSSMCYKLNFQLVLIFNRLWEFEFSIKKHFVTQIVLRTRIRVTVLFLPRDGKKLRSGFGINILDPISEKLETIYSAKNT